MNRLGRREKDKITQFRGITGASDKIATDCLRQANWSTEVAIELFYSSGLQASAALDTGAIEKLFLHYKAPHDDMILAEGISKFCEDLGVDPSDIIMLVISWHFNANIMCEYTHDEWVNGFVKLNVDSIDKLKAKVPELRTELRDPGKWREIYNYAYSFSREKGQKCVQLDTALGMWHLLFSEDRSWQYLDDWVSFLQTHHANRAISKDTWVQLFEFVKNIKPDFSNFDADAAWPYLLDEFVDYMREKKGIKVEQ